MKTKWKIISPYTGMEEDAPANAAGPTTGGNIAGLGTGKNEPGFYPKKKKKEEAVRHDGRTKGYREHRQKLEAAREKRKNRKELQDQKFAEDIKNKNLQMAWPSTASGIIPDTGLPMADLSNDLSNKKKSFKKK